MNNKVLLFDSAIYTTNLGDEIILNSIRTELSDLFENAGVFRAGTHICNLSPLQMLTGTEKLTEYIHMPLKIVAGTNLLARHFSPRNIHRQWQLFWYNKKLYQDCVLMGVGLTVYQTWTGPLTMKLYGKILSDRYIHSVRDEKTKEFLSQTGKKVLNTGCPTLWSLTPEFCAALPKKKASDCIFSVSGYGGQNDPKSDRIMLEILAKNYRNLFAWIQTTHDEPYLNSILPGGMKIHPVYSLERFRKIAEQGDVEYVGTRLHGGIFALQLGLRSLVIAIDERARGFYETNNLPILERSEIENRLEERICSEWKIQIRNDYDTINRFRSQF